MANFVLVHGAWHGGWCWRKVVEALRAAGHVAEAPDLPALGGDTTPVAEVDLQSNVGRVCDVIDALSGDVILVGHSLGGLTISQVAEQCPDRLAALVYLAAFMPVAGAPETDDRRITTPETRAAIALSEDASTLDFDISKARDVFYADCSDEDVAFACAQLRPQPATILSAAVQISEGNYGRVPRDYIVCLRDRALLPAGQQRLHEQAGCRSVYEMDTDHSPFFSAPEELTRVLGEIAGH
jgi:pimeloyl-ACP methyl ester carboxylesterase